MIFAYLPSSTVKIQLNVGKYTSPMDPMGMRIIFPGCLWCTWMLMLSDIYFFSKFGFAARMDHTDVYIYIYIHDYICIKIFVYTLNIYIYVYTHINNEGNDASPPRRYPQVLYHMVASKISLIYPYTWGKIFDEYFPIGLEPPTIVR